MVVPSTVKQIMTYSNKLSPESARIHAFNIPHPISGLESRDDVHVANVHLTAAKETGDEVVVKGVFGIR